MKETMNEKGSSTIGLNYLPPLPNAWSQVTFLDLLMSLAELAKERQKQCSLSPPKIPLKVHTIHLTWKKKKKNYVAFISLAVSDLLILLEVIKPLRLSMAATRNMEKVI